MRTCEDMNEIRDVLSRYEVLDCTYQVGESIGDNM